MNKDLKIIVTVSIVVLGLMTVLALNPLVVIGAGQRGVVFSNASGIKEQVLNEGMHFRTPFVESVEKINVRTQQTENVELIAADQANQSLIFKTNFGWHIDPNNAQRFFQKIGDDEKKKIDALIATRGQEAVKTAAAPFKAEEIQTRQQEVKAVAVKILAEDMATYSIIVDDVVFTDIDYTEQYNQALENRAQAKLQAEQAIYLKQKAQNEADAALVTASASARVSVIAAQAEAEKQRLLQESISSQLLSKMAIEKWDGKYPQTVLGNDAVPLINLNGN